MAKTIKGVDKLIKARASLLLAEPWYGVPALSLILKPVEDNPMLWAMGTDGKHLFFNPTWVESATLDEIKGVIVHEVWHIWSKHDLREGVRKAKHMKWNMACVTGDSLVTMLDGAYREIRHIKAGDRVLGEHNGRLVPSTVLTTTWKFDTIMEVKFHSGRKLLCTPTHRILTSRGYIPSEEIEEGTIAYLVGPRAGIYTGQSELHDDYGDGKFPGRFLPAGGQLSVQPWAVQAQEDSEEGEHSPVSCLVRAAEGVPSGDRGWRGDRHDSENAEGTFQTLYYDQQHKLSTASVAGDPELLLGDREEPKGQSLLAHVDQRVSNRRHAEGHAAISNREEAARGTGDPVHRDPSDTGLSRQAHVRNADYPCHDQGLEQERVASVRRLEETALVFDLTTTSHSYIANDIVVHNCDYAINPIIRSGGWRLPDGALGDEYKGQAVEWIFDKIPDPPEIHITINVGQGGQGKGKGGKQPPQGNKWDVGHVQANADVANGSKTPAEAEAQRNMDISNWYQSAKRAGKVPAELERIVGELMKVRMPWREILARFVDTYAANDYDHAICDPEYARYGCYMPSVRSEELGLVAYIGDTSGSINEQQHRRSVSEMQGILTSFPGAEILALWVDHALHNPEWISAHDVPLNIHPIGGGGTSFRPGFEYMKENQIVPKCVVYATDGYCDDFPDDPGVPVLWLVIEKNEDFSPPWGEVALCDFE